VTGISPFLFPSPLLCILLIPIPLLNLVIGSERMFERVERAVKKFEAENFMVKQATEDADALINQYRNKRFIGI
jgi:hypothetical protein